MIDMQLLGGVLMALAVLVGASIAISLAMMAAGSGARPARPARRRPAESDVTRHGSRSPIPTTTVSSCCSDRHI